MTNAQQSIPVHEMSFVPRDLVTVQVGRLSVSLYPKVETGMPVFERAHAFQVNKSALEPLPIDTRLILDALGAQLNCSAIVDGLMFDWRGLFDSAWYDFINLTIAGYHGSDGKEIKNCTIPGSSTILKPVQDGNKTDCRAPDVRFVRVTCSVDFSGLVTIAQYGPTTLRVGYYLELPQTTEAMRDGLGNDYNLTTWHGVSDLSTLSADEVRTRMLEPCLQDGPIALRPADFNLGDANIDAGSIRETIQAKILRLGFRQICASIFVQLCPGYSDQPHAVLEHIRQTSVGPDGQPVTASVLDYYQRMQNATRPFQMQERYPISVCDRFIQGLDRTILPSFRKMYTNHSLVHDLSGSYQRRMMSVILSAAQAAEDECKQFQDIARGMLASQGFFASVSAGAGAGIYASQAEQTLTKYDKDGKPVKRACWGCGGDHSWMLKGVIVCPRKNDPLVVQAAEKRFAEYKAKLKKGDKGKDGERRKGKRSVEFKDLDDASKKKMRETVLAMAAHDTSSTTSTVSSISNRSHGADAVGPKVFMLSLPVPVFNITPPSRRTLPVPIQAAFPHITLQLGSSLGDSGCPAIRCVVDTAAALTTGNLHFFAALAKAYPHTVASVHSPKDYSPITLSGIVQQGGSSVTTDLTVGFQFHLPYLTREGTPTSLVVATGPDVTVNAILGLPFITQTKMVIDTADQVAEMRAFDTPPFPIDFRRAMCAIPVIDESTSAANAALHANVVAEIEAIEAHIYKKCAFLSREKEPGDIPGSILMSPKRARVVDISDTSTVDGTASFATIGSVVDPFGNLLMEEDVPPFDKMASASFARGNSPLPDSDRPGVFASTDASGEPIRVARKIRGKKRPNVFLDDRGYPDQSHEFDVILHNVEGGPILRKRKHAAPPIDDVDPRFLSPYDEETHGTKLRTELDLSHLDGTTRDLVYKLLQKYWSVFDDKGQFVPVKDYKCSIDTGSARPICVKNINYGPREVPIMRKCIASLEKLGHIRQIHGGGWMFKALLAPKPHQEHVKNIDDFVWRFCINYIPLNQITRPVAYPIPRCDSAVHLTFGDGRYMWMWDAPQGYHQIGVESDSQDKLAFAGPDATKWTYNVMPFGPVNGPATFIAFIHDVDSTWKDLARSLGVTIDEDTNTNIIVDDILSWATSLTIALIYMECQLRVCQSQNLSLSLRKSHIFPKRFEFVGIDVSPDGNRPALSKHQLLTHWPTPVIVRDVAKFVGFMQFYSRFIPNFEVRITALRDILREEYTMPLGDLWTKEAQHAFTDMQNAILSDPCLRRYDHRKLLVLRTDFSAEGFGYAALQPADDEVSLLAMHRCMSGGSFDFMTKDSTATLHPVAFGCRRTVGNEKRLHSHLGEAFALDYAINKCRHMAFGQRFVCVTDCYALKFILSYDGKNPALLRLQMRFMCWDMVIEHRNDHCLVDADYFSRVGADLCYDPLLRDYIQQVAALRRRSPAPTEMPIADEHQPYFRGPRVNLPTRNLSPLPGTLPNNTQGDAPPPVVCGLQHLATWPIRFGLNTLCSSRNSQQPRALYNSDITRTASMIAHFDWAVYGFNSGHFLTTISEKGMPFRIVLACDPYSNGRSLFRTMTPCAHIFDGASALLDHVRSSGINSKLTGYLIHSHRYSGSDTTSRFWDVQSQIVAQLRIIRALSIVVAFVHPDHDNRAVSISFAKKLSADGWLVNDTNISFPDHGDSVVGLCRLIVAVHSNSEPNCSLLELRPPPQVPSRPLARFIWAPFNRPEMAVSYGKDDPSFNLHAVNDNGMPPLRASSPSDGQRVSVGPRVRLSYNLHRDRDNPAVVVGSSVVDVDGLCPQFNPNENVNLFGHYFGIEFVADGHTYVRAISPFEFVSCFRLTDELTYNLSQHSNAFCMDAAIPAISSARIFEQILDRCLQIRSTNFEICDPHQYAAPAAYAATYLNGAIGVRMPSRDVWVKSYADDPELSAVLGFVTNPGTISQRSLEAAKLDPNYRQALRQSSIHLNNGILFYHEPIAGSESFAKLQLVPLALRSIVFVAFHSNPLGGHLNASRTFHRIRLRFYWPQMYKYIARLCRSCPGCALTNPTKGKARELVYNFPVEAPFQVLHIDGYQAGAASGFEGSSHYLIAACGMCTFAAMEPVTNANASTYASSIMKIILRYGFCHTVVLDKDSKFFGVCREALDLLQVNCHVLSGGNHNPMIVERLNRYLNEGLRIMTNERDSTRIALEAILLLIYAWNSCPVPGTDISRSMVAVGREFSFPIDFSAGKHAELYSSPGTVHSYAKELAARLSSCREIAALLVKEHRCWHRELINSRRGDPRVFSVGDIVFARRATRSDSKRGKVDKLMHPYTGPWRIVASLSGASYELEFVGDSKRRDKKHASDLSPYPPELIPFQPVDGPDNRYGQLYKPIGASPYKEAGLKGFEPSAPFAVASHFARCGDFRDFHFPTLSELNDETWLEETERRGVLPDDVALEHSLFYTGPPPSPAAVTAPSIPPISLLVRSIIDSADKLFFVSHSLGNPMVREWRLVRVALSESSSISPSCLQDGRFLVEFYTLHFDDVRHNACNQRYWLQYHSVGDIATPTSAATTHFIRPSVTSEALAVKQRLVPFRRWLNLTHSDTYLHGPFDFASVNGRKTRDRISQADWDVLACQASKFFNAVPKFDMPSWSAHADRGVHVTFCDPSHVAALCAATTIDDNSSML